MYIIGSDQNLGKPIIQEFFTSWKNFLLKFVTWEAKRISYASSFGVSQLGAGNSFIKSKPAKQLMQKFDDVGLREIEGVKLAKKLWGIEARQVVDPTLLLGKDDYDELISNPTTKLHEASPVFYYLLRVKKDSSLFQFTERVASDLGMEASGSLTYDTAKLMPMEQWLKGFRDSDFVITNSFHGVLFSLINNTDFIVICRRKDSNGAVRFQDILGRLGLNDRIVFDDEFDDFDVQKLTKINWKVTNMKITEMRNDSAEWLLAALRRHESRG